jgi:hypothetical protein
MKKLIAALLIIGLLNLVVGCGGSAIRVDNAPIGESVVIKLIDGSERHGIILKTEANKILYMDADSHKPEDLELKQITSIIKSDKVYDMEGDIITDQQISEVKGMSKTLVYGFGGLVLGAAVGFGIAAIANNQDAEIAPIYPMAGLGIAGAIYFGIKGAGSDREDAIDEIRESRYEESQIKLRKRLEDEKQKLLDEKKKQDELKKELQKKEE